MCVIKSSLSDGTRRFGGTFLRVERKGVAEMRNRASTIWRIMMYPAVKRGLEETRVRYFPLIVPGFKVTAVIRRRQCRYESLTQLLASLHYVCVHDEKCIREGDPALLLIIRRGISLRDFLAVNTTTTALRASRGERIRATLHIT